MFILLSSRNLQVQGENHFLIPEIIHTAAMGKLKHFIRFFLTGLLSGTLMKKAFMEGYFMCVMLLNTRLWKT